MALAKRKPWSRKKKVLAAAGAVGALGLGALGARRLLFKKAAKGLATTKSGPSTSAVQDRYLRKMKKMSLHGAADRYKMGRIPITLPPAGSLDAARIGLVRKPNYKLYGEAGYLRKLREMGLRQVRITRIETARRAEAAEMIKNFNRK